MNTDNMYGVLPGEEDDFEEEDAHLRETPPQPTRQGVAGERSPNARALAAARAAAARRTRLRQEGAEFANIETNTHLELTQERYLRSRLLR